MLDPRLIRKTRLASVSLTLTIAASFLTGAVTVAQAYFLSRIIAGVFLAHQTLPKVMPLLLWLAALSVARAGAVWSGQIFAQRTAGRVKTALRDKLVAHVMALGPQFTRAERSGELINTAVEGIEALDAYFSQYMPQVAAAAFVPLTIAIFIFPNDVLSGLVLLFTAPIIPVFMILIGSIAEDMTKKQWRSLSRMSAHFLDVLQGLTTLKLLGRSREQVKTIAKISDRFRDATMAVLRVAFLSALVLELAATLSTAVVAVEIGVRLLYAKIAFQQALFVLILAPEFYQPLRMLGARFHAGMAGTAAAKRIFAVLDTPLPKAPTIAPKPAPRRMTIALKNVRVAFDDGARPALNGVSFTIADGETVALVGRSGAGKSTIAHLLLRFIAPQSGTITVDGVPLHQLDTAAWRAKIGWVPQMPYLFDATIVENIKLANPAASRADVRRAARLAHAEAFIEALPRGYDTRIGERGARLSGGQAQRIALARAFLKDAPFVIFDEATANLDPRHEAEIHAAMAALLANRTALMIAHRLNTITAADKILVLDGGTVVESGSHAELLAQAGLYHQLFRAFQGAI